MPTPVATLIVACPPICLSPPAATATATATAATAPALPALAYFLPSSTGAPGATIELNGTNLSGVTSVSFGGTPGTLQYNCVAADCFATVPPGTPGSTVNVTVTSAAGTSNALAFTYKASAGTSGDTSSGSGSPSTGTSDGSTSSSGSTGVSGDLSGAGSATAGLGGGSAGTTGGSSSAGAGSSGIGGGSTAAGMPVTYTAGWNIVGGPTGTTLSGYIGQLYTLQAGDADYENISGGAGLTQPFGYWAYFGTGAAAGMIPASTPQSLTVNLPAMQWVMIGNPGNSPAAVAGADVVYTYSASGGYQATTSLAPGQGGWAISMAGGTATIANG